MYSTVSVEQVTWMILKDWPSEFNKQKQNFRLAKSQNPTIHFFNKGWIDPANDLSAVVLQQNESISSGKGGVYIKFSCSPRISPGFSGVLSYYKNMQD